MKALLRFRNWPVLRDYFRAYDKVTKGKTSYVEFVAFYFVSEPLGAPQKNLFTPQHCLCHPPTAERRFILA